MSPKKKFRAAFCKRGHPLNQKTTYLRKDKYRECIQCAQERKKKYQAKYKEARILAKIRTACAQLSALHAGIPS
jgi:CRISPR/Cas system-associated protein endoribonuclease Cas2